MATISELAAFLHAHDEILLIAHILPDGDALGSSLALCRALTDRGKTCTVACRDEVPKVYRFLPGSENVCGPEALKAAYEAVLTVDVSDRGRMGDALAAVFDDCPARAALDHHATNPGFAPLNVIDARAAATGEIVLRLLDQWNAAIGPEIAACLFTAISTDCGNFNFSNTTPDTLRAAARCVEAGADVAELTRRLFRISSPARTRLIGKALAAIEFHDEGRIAVTRISQAMFAECGAVHADADRIVNFLNETEGVQVAILAEEQDACSTKISLRSVNQVDVATLAQQFGGGGHVRASGVSMAQPMDAAVDAILAAAKKMTVKA